MDRQIAERIVPTLMEAASQVAATIDTVRAHVSDDELKAYSNAVGNVVLAIEGVLRPIIIKYPDLHP